MSHEKKTNSFVFGRCIVWLSQNNFIYIFFTKSFTKRFESARVQKPGSSDWKVLSLYICLRKISSFLATSSPGPCFVTLLVLFSLRWIPSACLGLILSLLLKASTKWLNVKAQDISLRKPDFLMALNARQYENKRCQGIMVREEERGVFKSCEGVRRFL